MISNPFTKRPYTIAEDIERYNKAKKKRGGNKK